jgi:hypothetical protein
MISGAREAIVAKCGVITPTSSGSAGNFGWLSSGHGFEQLSNVADQRLGTVGFGGYGGYANGQRFAGQVRIRIGRKHQERSGRH